MTKYIHMNTNKIFVRNELIVQLISFVPGELLICDLLYS